MKKYLKIVGELLTLLSLTFIVYAVYKLGLDFSGITNIPLFICICTIGVILKTGTVFVSGYVWRNWVSFFARKPASVKEALYVYTKANTGKYLPGNVMQYVERNLFADKMGIAQKKIAASSLIEVISLVLVAFFVALFFSFRQVGIAIHAVMEALGEKYLFFIVLAVVLGCIFVFAILVFLRKKLVATLREYQLSDFIRQLVFSMVGQAIVLTVLGIIFVMLYVYMHGTITLYIVMNIISGYIISWVLGFVVPGAPGGIGIREMVLTLLVGTFVGKEVILTIALIHRLITIIGDFLAYLLGIVIYKKK